MASDSSSLERYRKRKRLKNSITILDDKNIEFSDVEYFLSSSENTEKVERLYGDIKLKYDMSVTNEEAKAFLEQFKAEFNQARYEQLISDCKREIVNSIVTPFGLGKIVAAYDKVGGNVDTVHNVEQGIYVTEEERLRYENRGEYNSDDYHKDSNYIKRNRELSEQKKNGELKDYMTGKEIKQNESYDADHVVSAKEVHDSRGRVLAEIDGVELANTETNIQATSSTNNRSKKADNMDKFIEKKNERIKKIDALEAKEELTQKEEHELRKIKKLADIDDRKAKKVDEKARKEMESKINKAYYTSKKFRDKTLNASADEGLKMGTQQALGLIMVEFFAAVFDEIHDIYKNGFFSDINEDFLQELKKRLERIATRLKEKWKNSVFAFGSGFISGFISNLVTTAINIFITTGKRLVRIIREGFFSLVKAIKLLMFPPKGMSFDEAMHEAMKLIVSGIIIGVGVVVEEWIDALINGTVILEPFSDVITAIFVGSLTGLAVTMAVYYLDKKKNDKEVIKQLIAETDAVFENVDNLLYPTRFA